jgi:hypothetical protein
MLSKHMGLPHLVGLHASDPSGSAAARTDTPDGPTRMDSPVTLGRGLDAPYAAHHAWETPIRQTKNHGRTGLRPDQTGTWVLAVLVAESSPSPRRMGADLYDPQRAEALEGYPLPTSSLGLQGRSGGKSGHHGT